ncbi:hypothetical protein L228DRAFT_212025 [Xylona heveae TC161]|uniref:AB hydrolase-1 domain-containing protein n=1 Tax=Xylona heveae (strain CBS 132557 / TC161) TaxID=1328760 RepID=A0A165FZ19_XYLHT|nr:hypothetical protein L228DRAFT_212025 [Xylona heveae TC161]KZF21551.1 hypothetical protein L228DRAFT_212025 [Xylona heveae TC161]
MIGTSTAEYVLLRAFILILQSLAPLSVIYWILRVFHVSSALRLPPFLERWALEEAIFCVTVYALHRFYLQRPAIHPPLLSREKRRGLVKLCHESIPDLGNYMSKWFLDAPLEELRRENVKEFYRWAFFSSAQEDPSTEEEVNEYVNDFEDRMGHKFRPGRANVKCLRLTFEKVDMLHRSLAWYLLIFIVDNITFLSLLYNGFQYYRGSAKRTFAVFPPRPQKLLAKGRAPVKNISYFYRPHTSRSCRPILFLHGIGVGLGPYVKFFTELGKNSAASEDGQIGILALEILPISSRITLPVLRKEEMCRQVRAILEYHGFDDCVLAAHSYGSVIATHLLQDPSVSERIASVVLVDPVSILLHLPDVAYNFTFRRPRTPTQWVLWFFGSMDVGVSHTLHRHFFWSENILWKEDLAGRNASIFLCERDSIVNTAHVRGYLETSGSCLEIDAVDDGLVSTAKTTKADKCLRENNIKLFWCTKLEHGEVFETKLWRSLLVKEMLKHTRRKSESSAP